MRDQALFSMPSDDAKRRMLSAAGKTIKIALNALTGGIGGDLAELGWTYISDHIKERNKRRAEEFKARIEKAGPEVQDVIESSKKSEPLFDVFLSVYRECLADDEDEKVQYYASFMALLALADPRPSHDLVMAILAKIRDLRAHDIRTLSLFGRTPPTQNGQNMGQLEARIGHMVPRPGVSKDLLPQSVSALVRHGLVTMTPFGLNAMVNADLHYKITEFGTKFVDFISADPSPTV